MPTAQQYAGITEAIGNVTQYNRDRPAREARVAEAQARRDLSQAKLQEHQAGAPGRQSKAELELETLKQELKTARHNSLKTDTYRSFDSYEGDGDTRHLNNLLAEAKKNPVGGNWNNWVRFDSVTRSPEVDAMFGQAGITDVEGYLADPNLAKSKIIGVDTQGNKSLIDVNKLYQATGYLRHASARTRQEQMERAKLDDLIRGSDSAETNMIESIKKENPNLTYLQAAQKFYEAKNAGKVTGSAHERVTAELMAKDPNLSYEDALKEAARLKAAPGSVEKNIEVVKNVRQQIHAAAGGDFYVSDLARPGQRDKVGELISDLEAATGKKLGGETKRVARQLRSMAALGGTAGAELTNEETGFMDNLLFNVKKYFSDNISGSEGVATYSAMRNFARNALMGATLTPKELSEFDKAAGTLKQQLGPVLSQLKVQLQDIKGQIESVMAFEDPMMAKYYLGMSQDQAGAAIDQINSRLEHISGYKAVETKQPGAKAEITVDMNKSKVNVKPIVDGQKPTKSASDRFKELTGES